MPPPNASAPLPRLLFAATEIVPALIVVPPWYVLTPVRVSVPLPALVMPPPPEIPVPKVTLLPLVSKVPPPLPIGSSRGEMSIVLPAAH